MTLHYKFLLPILKWIEATSFVHYLFRQISFFGHGVVAIKGPFTVVFVFAIFTKGCNCNLFCFVFAEPSKFARDRRVVQTRR